MVVAARLANAHGYVEIASYVHEPLSWWVLQGADGAELGDALAALLSRLDGVGGGSWTGRFGGAPDRLKYVIQDVDEGLPRLRAHTARTDSVRLTSQQAVAVLDRAETVAVDVLLTLTTVPGALPVLLRSNARGTSAVVVRNAGSHWAVVGLNATELPPLPAVVTSRDAAVLPSGRSEARTLPSARSWRPAAIALAVAIAGAVTLGAPYFRQLQRSPERGVTPPRQVAPEATAPEPENQPSLAYDPRDHSLLLFGGLQPRTRTWVLAGSGWRARAGAPSPSDRFGAAMAYDEKAHRVVLFGGRARAGAVNNDTWTWDGSAWALQAATTSPPGLEFSGMAWDQVRRQMVLVTPPNVGIASGPAVTWTLGSRGWVRATSPINPPAEPSSALSFDPATRTVLLVLSGLSPGATPSTWSWDGAWHQLHPAHEPDLGGFTAFLAPVPATRQMILTRVSVSSPPALETWTWDGSDWTRQHPRDTPTGLVGLVADDVQGRVVAIGHVPGAAGLQAAWTWTGSDWTRFPLQVGAKL